MSHSSAVLDSSIEMFALQQLQVAPHVATDATGQKIPQVALALIGASPKIGAGPKTYGTFISVGVARQLGGTFATSADEACAEAGWDPEAPASALTTSASMADVAEVARQALAADRLRA